jgi:alanine racemase
MPNARTWIELSRSALQHNLTALRSVIGRKPAIAPVIKANAYGHGWPQVLSMLKLSHVWGVCVAYGQEALELRSAGWTGTILVLSNWDTRQLPDLIRRKIDLVAWDFESWQKLLAAAHQLSQAVKIHLKLDSGTTRIGFQAGDLKKLLRAIINTRKHVKIAGVFSHLANAEESSRARTNNQIKRFTTLQDVLGRVGGVRHLAGSAAALRYPASRLDLIRYGVGLYGLWPSSPIQAWAFRTMPKFELRPVLSWHSRLVQVKTVARGTTIGYGSTVTVKRPTKIGIVPVGYSDGYDRRASNRSWMMVAGNRAPVIGRVSMNLSAIDITRIRAAKPGGQVNLIGPGCSADDLATAWGTINYEVVARINPLIPRVVIP